MKNYKTSQCFHITGYVELPYIDTLHNITEYNFLVNSLRNFIINGGNLEKGDEISIKWQKENGVTYSQIKVDKIDYTINENGVVDTITLLLYAEHI